MCPLQDVKQSGLEATLLVDPVKGRMARSTVLLSTGDPGRLPAELLRDFPVLDFGIGSHHEVLAPKRIRKHTIGDQLSALIPTTGLNAESASAPFDTDLTLFFGLNFRTLFSIKCQEAYPRASVMTTVTIR
jgi:hypothetical protein